MARPKLADLAGALSKATADARAEAGALAARHAALTKEREATRTALLPAAECEANARRLVAAARQEWLRTYGRHVVKDLSGGITYIDGSTREVVRGPALPSWGALDGRLTFADVCGLFPDLAVDALSRTVREAGADHGLDEAARAKRLAEIDAELAAIEAQHAELVAGAAAAGLFSPSCPRCAQGARPRRPAERSRWVPQVRGATPLA